MKTIKKAEEINFNALTFKDAITLLPLMNTLAETINRNRLYKFYQNLPKEDKEKYSNVWRNNLGTTTPEELEQCYELLNNLGFESQIELKEPTIKDLELKSN